MATERSAISRWYRPRQSRWSLAAVALHVGWIVAGCGGSHGSSSPPPTATPSLTSREAVANGAGAATSLALLVEAILGDNGSNDAASRPPARYLLPAEVLLARYSVGSGGDGPRECPAGGAMSVHCVDREGGGELSGEFSDCRIELSEEVILRLNGQLELRFPGTICENSQAPGAVFSEGRYHGLITEIVDRATETVDERIRFDLDLLRAAAATGCAGPIGPLVLDGRLSLQRPPSATSMEADLLKLAVELTDDSGAGSCLRVGDLTGMVAIDHLSLGRRVRLELRELRARVESYGPLDFDVSLSGRVISDCAGPLQIETTDPVHHGFFQDCADFGHLRLTPADGSTGDVRFTDHGRVGFDFDGDGNYEAGGEGCATLPQCGVAPR